MGMTSPEEQQEIREANLLQAQEAFDKAERELARARAACSPSPVQGYILKSAEGLSAGDPVVVNAVGTVERRLEQVLSSLGQDRLHKMMMEQAKMMKLQGTPIFQLGEPLGHHAKKLVTQWTGEFVKAIIHEAAELEDWFPWKHWSVQPGNKSDIQLWSAEHAREARKEVVDIMHFLLSLALLYGMTADDIYNEYVGKFEENIQRHESGTY